MDTQSKTAAPPRSSREISNLMGGLLAAGLSLWLFGYIAGPHGLVAQLLLTAEAPAPAVKVRTLDERAAILDLIRDHRAAASDGWHLRLADAIYRESVAAAVDPLMIASIVAAESSFRTRVVSSAGAVGLMQLRPFVAEDVAQRRNVEWTGPETLESPDVNVRLGVLYFQELVQRFDGDQVLALTAYNYGPTRVAERLREGGFSGASGYASRVLTFYDGLRSRALRGA